MFIGSSIAPFARPGGEASGAVIAFRDVTSQELEAQIVMRRSMTSDRLPNGCY